MNNNYTSLLLIILSILSVFFLKESYGQDAKQTMETIRKHAVSQTRLLGSIKFSFVTDIPGIGIDNATYYLSGNKFYSELEMSRADTNIKPQISAYDGDKYQVLDRIKNKQGEYLAHSSSHLLPTASGTLNPIILPYGWLFEAGQSIEWTKVKDESLWKNKFSNAVYIRQLQEDGHIYEIVKLAGVLPDTVTEVYFASDLNYYPLKTITKLKDGSPCNTGVVRRYKTFDIDGETLVIPLELSFEQQTKTKNYRGLSKIHENTLEVNLPLDDDFFTISPTRANEVIDIDERARLLGQQNDDGVDVSKKRFLFVKYFLILVGGGMIFYSLWKGYQERQKKKSQKK
jgi:hypothetical protein